MIIFCNMVLCGSQSPEKVIQVWQNFRKQNTIDHRTGHCKMHCMALWWERPYLGLWSENATGELSRTSGLSLHPPMWDFIPKGKASSPNLHPWRPRAHKLPFGVLVPKERRHGNHCWCLLGTPQVALLDDLALEDRGSLVRRSWGFGQKNLDAEDKKGHQCITQTSAQEALGTWSSERRGGPGNTCLGRRPD